ncbi:MAG: hypothetical protein V1493_02015 [Candidatus Diapherotrites archaeon]
MFFNDWLDILLFRKKPAQLVAEKPALGKALALFIAVFVSSGAVQLAAIYLSPEFSSLFETFKSGFNFDIKALLPLFFALGLAFALVYPCLLHFFAKIVGGKGELRRTLAVLFSVNVAFLGTVTMASSVLFLLWALVPSAAPVYDIWNMVAQLAGFYELAWIVLVLKELYSFSLGRAIVVAVGIPIILVLILVVFSVFAWLWLLSIDPNVSAGMFSLLR